MARFRRSRINPGVIFLFLSVYALTPAADLAIESTSGAPTPTSDATRPCSSIKTADGVPPELKT
jgi:hypothetical protein